jgi:hypothetical protein
MPFVIIIILIISMHLERFIVKAKRILSSLWRILFYTKILVLSRRMTFRVNQHNLLSLKSGFFKTSHGDTVWPQQEMNFVVCVLFSVYPFQKNLSCYTIASRVSHAWLLDSIRDFARFFCAFSNMVLHAWKINKSYKVNVG